MVTGKTRRVRAASTVYPLLGVLVACLGGAQTQAGRTIYVHSAASGAEDGASWSNAYTDLQDALDDARASGDLDAQIWIAKGTYKPDRGTKDLTLAFELFGTIAIYGGFEGWEECLDERVSDVEPTVLSGDLLEDDDLAAPPLSDCCILPYPGGPPATCSDLDCRTRVVEISGQCASGRAWTQTCASTAIDQCCELCRPTRCDNSKNILRATEPGSAPRLDGLTVTSGEYRADPTGETAYEGTALSSSESSPVVSNSVFTRHRGGAAVDSVGGVPVIRDCTFTKNLGDSFHISYSNLPITVERCRFESNLGSGLFLSNVGAAVADCVFRNNGLGLLVRSSGVVVIDSKFIANRTFGIDTFFGSQIQIYRSVLLANALGGLHVGSGWAFVIDSLFSGNSASGSGAGIYSDGAVYVLNSTIVGNSAPFGVGGIWATGYASVENSILWGNSNGQGTGSQAAQIATNGTIEVNHSVVQAWTGSWGGVGNSNADPLFIDADGLDDIVGTEDDDLRLSPDSPAINAGDPDFVAVANETDLDGHMRVLCEGVDIGAYEMGIGDYDCNRTVDLTDFAAWQGCMTGPRNPVASARGSDLQSTIGCAAFDFNANGAIDLFDFAAFQPILSGQ